MIGKNLQTLSSYLPLVTSSLTAAEILGGTGAHEHNLSL